jgi:hypothetical protein
MWFGARFGQVIAVALAAMAFACGSRSQLREATGQGAGGSTGGAGEAGAVGGAAGTGGAAGSSDCAELSRTGPLVAVQSLPSHRDRFPVLLPSNQDGSLVTIAYVREFADVTEIRHASFQPWSAWPANGFITTTHLTRSHENLSTIFAADGPTGANQFAVATVVPGTAVLLAPTVSATASGGSSTTNLPGSLPRFLSVSTALGSGAAILAGSQAQSGELFMDLRQPDQPPWIDVLGCSPELIAADAVPFEAGWLVAFANGDQDGEQPGCDAPAGSPVRIDAYWVGSVGGVEWIGSHAPGAGVKALALASHPRGAWLVFRDDLPQTPVVRQLRIDAVAKSMSLPIDVSGAGDLPLELGATAVQNGGLAVVWGNAAGSVDRVMVSVFDDQGLLSAQAEESVPPLLGSPSIIGSPEKNSVVAAWPQAVPNQLIAARWDCIGGR